MHLAAVVRDCRRASAISDGGMPTLEVALAGLGCCGQVFMLICETRMAEASLHACVSSEVRFALRCGCQRLPACLGHFDDEVERHVVAFGPAWSRRVFFPSIFIVFWGIGRSGDPGSLFLSRSNDEVRGRGTLLCGGLRCLGRVRDLARVGLLSAPLAPSDAGAGCRPRRAAREPGVGALGVPGHARRSAALRNR